MQETGSNGNKGVGVLGLARYNDLRHLLKEIQTSADQANFLLAKGEESLARTYIAGINKRNTEVQAELARLRGN